MKKTRLDCIVSLIRDGVRIADVGCDHAYITTEALRCGKATFSVASDIRPGPLCRAEENVTEAGFSDRVKLVLADGLDGIEQYSPDDIIIAGMGGELIADIIERAPFVKNKNIRLILQPMTSQDKLRAYLCSAGFEITKELLPVERSHIYQVIAARYTGVPYTLTPAELYVGSYRVKIADDKETFRTLLRRNIEKYEKIKRAKGASSDTEKETLLIQGFNAILKEINDENG